MDTNFITSSDLLEIYNEFVEHSKPEYCISVCLDVKPNDTFGLDIYYSFRDSNKCHEIFFSHRIDKSCMYDVISFLSNLTYSFDFNFYLS